MVNAEFAYLFTPPCKRYAKSAFTTFWLRFISQFAQIYIIFALSKFEANPFFRPVPLFSQFPLLFLSSCNFLVYQTQEFKKNLRFGFLHSRGCHLASYVFTNPARLYLILRMQIIHHKVQHAIT